LYRQMMLPEEITHPAVKDWMESYSKQIDYAITNKISNNETIPLWNDILQDEFILHENTEQVGPLLSTTWGQGCGYNTYCPMDFTGPCDHTVTGCVATAMGQVMKYWNHPIQGNGWYGYTDPNYGYQYAVFGTTNFLWGNMPNNSGNLDVALLLACCGVSVEMHYGPGCNGCPGSSAYTSKVDDALENYFNYKPSAQYKSKTSQITWEQWRNILYNELNNSRPMVYRGDNGQPQPNYSGHAFVCDGYNGTQFSFNWGWSGSSNGFYSLSALTPGNSNYTNGQAAVIGIEPDCHHHLTIPFQNTTINGTTANYEVSDFIRVAENSTTFNVINGGSVSMTAGNKINLKPGTYIHEGSYFNASNAPCGTLKEGDILQEGDADKELQNPDIGEGEGIDD